MRPLKWEEGEALFVSVVPIGCVVGFILWVLFGSWLWTTPFLVAAALLLAVLLYEAAVGLALRLRRK